MHDRDDGLVSTAQAAKITGLSRPTIYNYVHQGHLTPAKRVVTLGGYTRYWFDRNYLLEIKRIMEEYPEDAQMQSQAQ